MPDPHQKTAAILERISTGSPEISAHAPVTAAVERAQQLKEPEIQAALKSFVSMPQSTMVIANPPLHHVPVDCAGASMELVVRNFKVRGLVSEGQLVSGAVDPVTLFFVGLFGRLPVRNDGADEGASFREAIDQAFYLPATSPDRIREVAHFVHARPGLGPELTIQCFLPQRKAARWASEGREPGVTGRRPPHELLAEMIDVHMESVALGGMTALMNHLLRRQPGLDADDLVQRAEEFIDAERTRGAGALEAAGNLLLGRRAGEAERIILERMGVIQTHHGSAGSNMVVRYLATLYAPSVCDLFLGGILTMEGYRHFGAIHDMTRFMRGLEGLDPEERDRAIRERVLGGGLPTFGHPEISAGGRGHQVEQDPRPAIYLTPLFSALDSGEIRLEPGQRERLALLERVYQIAFVEGVVKPGREGQEPLRLTPNTDFGAWGVQEALGIVDSDRTFLTIIYRGFGWMMDVREQLKQPIIRPVIAPDPGIVPSPGQDPTVADLVRACHERLAKGGAFEMR